MNFKEKLFLYLNILLLVFSSILIFYGIDGSIQERIHLLYPVSLTSFKLLFQTFGLLILGFLFLFVVFKLINARPIISKSKKRYSLLILCWLLYFISIFFLLAKRWAEDRFPMEQPDIIFFNIITFNGESIDNSIFIESGFLIFLGFLISFLFCLCAYLLQSKTSYSFLSISIIKNININFLYLIFGIFLLVASLVSYIH